MRSSFILLFNPDIPLLRPLTQTQTGMKSMTFGLLGLGNRETSNLKVVLINYIVGAFKGNVKQTPLFLIEEIINKMIFIKTEKPQINNFGSIITKQSVLQIEGVNSLLHHGEMWSSNQQQQRTTCLELSVVAGVARGGWDDSRVTR